ncbi:hypothetical protein RIF29_37643 [Crotalaria pallida]|uniref:Uncharacterized protein n=1 Tax=Crotalaria pallida TaxID=3830 RepID=A0AAN9ECT6_CROPI
MMSLLQSTINHLPLPLPLRSQSTFTCRRFPSSSSSRFQHTNPSTYKPTHPLTLTLTPIGIPLARARVVDDSQESSESESEPEPEAKGEYSELATELKKAMQERKDNNNNFNFWGGVAKEISEIEWPAFGKVLGTSGVVLAVIFASSVVLLTLNAVLAQLSDTLFAARGLQDFFSTSL